MPSHGSGIEHVTFHSVKFTHIFELAADLSNLSGGDKPFQNRIVLVAGITSFCGFGIISGDDLYRDRLYVALRGLARGKSHVISGWMNLFMVESERLVPRSLVTRLAGRMMRAEHGDY